MKPIFGSKKLSVVFLGALIFGLSGCSNTGTSLQKPPVAYPIASDPVTTLERAVIPDAIPAGSAKIFPYEISKYKQNGYGSWHYGPAVTAEKRLDLMPATYTGTAVTHTARLLNFFAMSDIHITDEETPAQAVTMGYKGGYSSAYSPTIMLTTQVLDAAVQTVNALHQQKPFDFGISLGDTVNNNQYNELRWYIDVMDGKVISPDSGVKDDPVPGPLNDYQDTFQSAGLDKTIPWYQTLGNHDHWWSGVAPVNDYLRQTSVGENILNLGDVFKDPAGIDSRGFYMGSIDGSTPNGDVIGAGPVSDFANPPKVKAADPNRHPLSVKDWMSEFFKTASTPVGHGFSQANLTNDFASYSFEPKSDLPVKVIVLDDTQADVNYNILGQAYLDQARYDWLIGELDKGQAEGKLMIVAAHMPISLIGLTPNSPITAKTLLPKLQTYPNLILWIAGHRHRNVVTVRKSQDPAHPELGFWEVETPSLRDFPQEFRTFEIDRNSDNTISILTTDVDPAVKDGSLAALSRSYAVATQQFTLSQKDLLPTGSYNAELVKPLSPAMVTKLQNDGTPIH
jgi:metallophosphoesterase (TIGR03768 family)